MRAKRIFIFLLILTVMFTSGCWDKVEIEQRAIIGAMLVDLSDEMLSSPGEDPGQSQQDSQSPFCDEQKKTVKVTFGMINPSKIQTGEMAYMIRSVEGANVADAMEKFGEMTSRTPYYAQTRVLYLSERLLKNQRVFKEVLDEFERKAILNETMQVVAVKGNPDNLKKVEPELENTLAAYIIGILQNSRQLSNTVSVPLYQLLSKLRNNDGSAAIPVLEMPFTGHYEAIVNKLALIKDYKFLTYLDTKYVKSFKILNDDFQSGRKLVKYKNITLSYFIFSAAKRVWLEGDENRLKYKVKVELEGDVEAFEFDKDLFDSKTIKEISSITEETMKKELEEATKYFQKEIGHDYIKFGDYTHKYHNKVYKKYEDNWDEAFKNAEIDYEVVVYIRRIGTSKK